MEYAPLKMYTFTNPKLSLIWTTPRTRLFGLWRVYCITEKPFTRWNKKLGRARDPHANGAWKYKNKGWTQLPAILSNTLTKFLLYVMMPVSAWCYIPTSLSPEPSSILYYLKLFRALDTLIRGLYPTLWKGFVRYIPSPFYIHQV